jgi:hypothetical protein
MPLGRTMTGADCMAGDSKPGPFWMISHVPSRSTAASQRPASDPSGPEMRCSSSWMIRSGGRSGGTRSIRAAGWWFLAGCCEVSVVRPVRVDERVPCRQCEQSQQS